MTTPQFPLGSFRAIGALKASANTFEVYVEDSTMIPQWTNYVRKCLPAGAKLTSVNAIGSRKDVIDLCRRDQANDGRKRIYIVDGDLDFISGKGIPRLKYLHRIPYTNIESTVFDATAIGELCAIGNGASKAVERDAFKLYFETNWNFIADLLGPFFAVNSIFSLGIETCSCHVTRFSNLNNGLYFPDRVTIGAKLHEIRNAARGKSGVKKQIRSARSRAKSLPKNKILSGKSIILPIVSHWVTHRGAAGISPKMLINILIDKNRAVDRTLKNKLRAMMT